MIFDYEPPSSTVSSSMPRSLVGGELQFVQSGNFAERRQDHPLADAAAASLKQFSAIALGCIRSAGPYAHMLD